MAANVLVTGGAGFIGSHLVRALLEAGDTVRVLDNLATGKAANLTEVANDIDMHEVDLRDYDACLAACEGVEVVYHLGALGSVPRSIDDPATSNAVNVLGTLNILMAANKQDVRRVVYSSSSSVYGDTPILPKHEAMRPSPRSPYAVTKLAAEEYCRAFYRTYGLETVSLRYFNVFGPRQDPYSQYSAVFPRFITALMNNESPVLYGDGKQSRDFTFVSNVVNANQLAAVSKTGLGEACNVACGEQITLLEALSLISDVVGRKVEPCYLPERVGDVKHSKADISAAREHLKYEPQILFAEGMRKTVPSYVDAVRV